jgi:hypothetical protein
LASLSKGKKNTSRRKTNRWSWIITIQLWNSRTIHPQCCCFDKTELNAVMTGINEALKNFESQGISQQIDRIKGAGNCFTTDYRVFWKGFQLALWEIFAGTPDFINQDVIPCCNERRCNASL